MNETFEMVAKTLYGLEEILAGELLPLGANNIQIGRRMVSFTGDKEVLYKANFYCRTALRILKPIYKFKAKDADTVYNEVKKIEWENYLSLEKTFAIDSVIYSEDFNHSKFVAYRTKDAIVDYFVEKFQKRPSVRVNNPDIYINIHISHNDCTVSIDSSGESLHKRGYRVDQTEAPLNEVLAAGMILKTGWKGDSNFIDPMCGSGTLLIEAAMIARNIAPGVYRKEFAFEKWIDFDQELFDRIYNDDSNEREFNFKCIGSDINPGAIEIAEKNVRSAGMMKYIDLKVMPFQQYTEAPRPGIMVTNPPYGERITSKDLLGLYNMIGERLKHVFMDYQVWIISYKEECFEKIGLRPSEKIKLMNGSLECEYRCYEIFEGKNKDYKKALNEGDRKPGFRNDDGEKRERRYPAANKSNYEEHSFKASSEDEEFEEFLNSKGKHFARRHFDDEDRSFSGKKKFSDKKTGEQRRGEQRFDEQKYGERKYREPRHNNDRKYGDQKFHDQKRGDQGNRKPYKRNKSRNDYDN